MLTVRSIRETLLGSLPTQVRAVLATDDDEALARALKDLSDEEQEKVRDIIRELAALSLGGPPTTGECAPDQRDDPQIDIQAAHTLPFPPAALFRIRGGEELRPPQEWLDSTHMGEGDIPTGSVLYPVWYATTRQLVQDGHPEKGFTGHRDETGTIHYGVARVFVPESHQPGDLGSHWLRRWLWTWQDDRLVLRRIEGRTESEFWRVGVDATPRRCRESP
jgi:hypothetical protein